ncbi:MAG: hypothetical protein JST80_07385 [Bdellovibrionales bacterium]|nr:hypothetical protein [Bdellovibrionales bacterium]
MTILNWIPEILILIQFALVLGGAGFRTTSSHLLIFVTGLTSFFGAFYYGARSDLFTFDSPLMILFSDAVSRYCRMISLFMVAVGSWQLALHSGLSVVSKLRGQMGLLSGAFFLCLLSQSNHWVSTYIGLVGLIISGMSLVMVESNASKNWTEFFGKTTFSILMVTSVFLVLFLVGEYLMGTGYINEFMAGLKGKPELIQCFVGFLILYFSFWLLHGIHIVGLAPMSLPYFNLFCFFGAILFLIRVAVPFYAQFEFLPKMISQSVLGVVLTTSAVRYSLMAARTKEPNRWLSNMLAALFSLSLFPLLLPSNTALPILFTLLVGLLMTTTLLGRAFLGGAENNRWFSVVAVLAGLGFPPLMLGYQYFLILKELHTAELAPFSVAFLISWFFISIAAVQMITQILRRHHDDVGRTESPGNRGDWSLLTLVMLCVILMTAFGKGFVSRLNTQPIPNLW